MDKSDGDLVKITGMMLRDKRMSEWIELAFFDCNVCGIGLSEVLLIKTPKGGFAVRPPRIISDKGRACVAFVDNSLQHKLTQAALRIYREFGGQHQEYGRATSEPSGTSHLAVCENDIDSHRGGLDRFLRTDGV